MHIETFTVGGAAFLAVANYRNSSTGALAVSSAKTFSVNLCWR
jgi:hypothetical protein